MEKHSSDRGKEFFFLDGTVYIIGPCFVFKCSLEVSAHLAGLKQEIISIILFKV
jgi:hypothetical protein